MIKDLKTCLEYLQIAQSYSYDEASRVDFSELPKDAQRILKPYVTGNAYSGIHGNVAQLKGGSLTKKQIEQLANIKTFRFIRINDSDKDYDKEKILALASKTGTVNIDDGSIHF